MNPAKLSRALISGLLILLLSLPAGAATRAGTAVFVSGEASATDTAGSVRMLKSRDPVYSGDLLETRKGRIQIKYLDGAFMSIQPNSRFLIENYNFENRSDGTESAIYNLIKGGMRAFTGLIGKKRPEAYKVKTPMATIGIRGTGHNTRVCAGDCTGAAGEPLPDGLYHSTWEGTTTVENEFGISVVAAGKSVFVEDIDAPAQETSAASQVTAVQPSGGSAIEAGGQQGSEATVQAGEQLSPSGNAIGIPVTIPADPPAIIPVSTEVDLDLVSIEPDPADVNGVDTGLLFQTTAFFGPDGPIGAYGEDINDGSSGTLATIDPFSILASTDPQADAAREVINNVLANPANSALIDDFLSSPAHIENFTVDSDISWGRWTDGKVLLLKEDGSVSVSTLSNDQSYHYIFGNQPALAAPNAVGAYEFIGGTSSTGSIGDGATSGRLEFYFGDMDGTIVMTVSHGLIYTIEGPLLIDVVYPALFAGDGTIATTTSGDCAGGGCTAFIEGSFFGPLVEDGPAGAGLEYNFQDSGEIITGVAAFTNVTATAPPPPRLLEVIQLADQDLLEIQPNLARNATNTDNADGGVLQETTVLVGSYTDDSSNMIGVIGTDASETGSNETPNQLITVAPQAILEIENPVAGTIAAQDYITSALANGGDDAAAVNAVIDDPASAAEYTSGTYLSSDYAYGRWTDGKILFVEEALPDSSPGTITAEVDTLEPGQSLAFMFGDRADTNFGNGATGTYDLLGGTASTGTHDGTIGQGVQSGSLVFDFDTLNGRIEDMEVLHGDTYMVNGYLLIDENNQASFSGIDYGVSAQTTGGTCDSGCETLIDGRFFGAHAGSGDDQAPVLAGLDYEIVTDPFDGTNGNSITGNAVFGRGGTADPLPYRIQPGQELVSVLPDPSPPSQDEFADVGLHSNATYFMAEDEVRAYTGTDTGEAMFVVATIDPLGIAAEDPLPTAVAENARLLINDAIDADLQNSTTLVEDVADDPAEIKDFFQGDSFALFRWTKGNVLLVKEAADGSTPPTVAVLDLSDKQGLHGIYGPPPATPVIGATGTYEFIAGTSATTATGNKTGDGVTSGTLTFDFDNLSGQLDMNVDHDNTDYVVAGTLAIDNTNPGRFLDNGVNAITPASNECTGTGCTALIDGAFFGELSGGAQGSPAVAGLEYDIDAVGGIMGVAAFGRTGP